MISIIICSKNEKLRVQVEKNIADTIGVEYELIIIDNTINPKGICAVYNIGATQTKHNILCFVHEDVLFTTNNWGSIILNHINEGADVIGIAGARYKSKTLSGWFTSNKNFDCGNFTHVDENGKLHKTIFRPPDTLYSTEKVCCIDGVFMIVRKKVWEQIHFNEDVFKGFHVYDIDFSLRAAQRYNVIVTYLVDIIHLSCGNYGESWVKDTFLFHDYYKNNLPQAVRGVDVSLYEKKEWKIERFWLGRLKKSKLPKECKQKWIKRIKAWKKPALWKRAIKFMMSAEEKKIKILIGCLFFFDRTGSAMYVFELAKHLVKLGYDVTVVSSYIDGPLPQVARSFGIRVSTFKNLSRFNRFDIIHTQHQPITRKLIKRFPKTKKIMTIHSEVLDVEYPIIHPSIMKYIAVRPAIVDMLINKFQIPNEKVSLIYNPIDNEKFAPSKMKGENSILFVGTIDYLRKAMLWDMVEHTQKRGMALWIVGKNQSDYLPLLLENEHVKYYDPTPDVEQYIHRCTETVGILLGRTTIEGWMCGKPGWIYEVDTSGSILSKNFFDPPSDLEKFFASNVAKQIMNEYIKILS